jgi:nucleotide-binding universal stress UspA family protein
MIKDLLVHLEGSKEDEIRLAYAQLIASDHRAFLTGLFCNIVPDNIYVSGGGALAMAGAVSEMKETAVKAGNEMEKKLKKQLDKMDVSSELRRLDLTYAHAGQAMTAEARTADLFIATRPYNHHSATPELLETVLFNSGRGVLFTPPAIKPVGKIDNILVAWRNRRETARAVSEALPMLREANNVSIAMVAEKDGQGAENEMPGADIARHLDRHGVNVEIRHIKKWSKIGDALLNEVEKTNSKMLVMGGYGHSRFREWVLGGATREILSEAQVPVLISH